jgi:Cellulase (glycosyl hydrolase family 5)
LLRSHLLRNWSLAILALVALVAVAARPAEAEARPFVTGISGIGDYSPLSFSRTREAGADFVRLVLDWPEVAPKNQPASWNPEDPGDAHYNWSYIDIGVKEAAKAGLQPVLLIDGAPTWAQRCKAPAGLQATELCDPDPAALAAFATAAARRYSGSFAGLPRVQYWQGLNEPNLTLFFFPQFNTNWQGLSPGLYRALINSFYTAIKAVDPSNLVIAAGLGPTELKGYNIGPMRFTRELLCMKGKTNPKPIKGACPEGVHFDIFDIHPYSTGGPTHEGRPNDVQAGDLAKLQTLLKAADKAGRIQGQFKRTPLWITEFSWDSDPPDPGGLPMRILTQWTAEAMHEAWVNGVSHFFWYSLRDEPFLPNVPSSITVQSGLYFRADNLQNDQPKEVLATFHFPFVAFAGKKGLEFWGRTPSSQGGQVRIEVFRGGKWRKAGTATADSQGIFKGTAKTKYGRNKKGAARAVYSGHIAVPFPMKRIGDFHHPPFG